MANRKGTSSRPVKVKKSSSPGAYHHFKCLPIKQGKYELVCFVASAKEIWEFSDVNERDTDKKTGYQRVLSDSRVDSVQRFIDGGNAIPNSVLLTLDSTCKLNDDKTLLTIPKVSSAAWIIDGQHRLAGASRASNDIEIAVLAFIGLDSPDQIMQFVTINKEAKGVPATLYLDLLKQMPKEKSDGDLIKERAMDIVNVLKNDETSPFYQKIAVLKAPQKGQISNTNFVRKISPVLRVRFKNHTILQQTRILDVYFKSLQQVFPDEFKNGTFFRTLGFGAVINALPQVFDITLAETKKFAVTGVVKTLKIIEDFDFSLWNKMGTGSAAENTAGEALVEALQEASKEENIGQLEFE